MVDNINVSSGIGRIPNKISIVDLLVLLQTSLKIGFICLLSSSSVFLLTTSLECWHHFVLVCCICKPIASQHDVLLLRLSQRVEQLYGTSSITPNMNMHCHLKDFITNYGSVHGFGLFLLKVI